MATFSPQEVHFPQDGQTDIVLSSPYLVGQSELMVFLNGMLAVIGTDKDYIEVDPYTIRFNYQLSADDVVVTQHQVYFDDKSITVIGDTGEGLFSEYGAATTLMENQRYKVAFEYEGQTFSHEFMTKLNPAYSTITIIRSDLGEVIRKVKDMTIMFQIYQNSVLARELASEQVLTNFEDTFAETGKTPYAFKQYVRYRTELDLMISLYMTMSGNASSESKILGELEIERRFSVRDIKPFLQELKNKLKPWEAAIRGLTANGLVASAVKGGSSSAYPLNNPRRTFNDGVAGGGS